MTRTGNITLSQMHKVQRERMMNSNVQITFECHDDMSAEKHKKKNYIIIFFSQEYELYLYSSPLSVVPFQ